MYIYFYFMYVDKCVSTGIKCNDKVLKWLYEW